MHMYMWLTTTTLCAFFLFLSIYLYLYTYIHTNTHLCSLNCVMFAFCWFSKNTLTFVVYVDFGSQWTASYASVWTTCCSYTASSRLQHCFDNRIRFLLLLLIVCVFFKVYCFMSLSVCITLPIVIPVFILFLFVVYMYVICMYMVCSVLSIV